MRYCDKSCQQKHWKAEHREVCVGRKEKKHTSRPAPSEPASRELPAPAAPTSATGASAAAIPPRSLSAAPSAPPPPADRGNGGVHATPTPAYLSSAARAAAKKKRQRQKQKQKAAGVGGGAAANASGGIERGGGGGGGAADVGGGGAGAATATAFYGEYVRGSGGAIVRRCAHCGVEESEMTPLQQCVRCKRVAYCSAEHQKKHWSHGGHKDDCAQQQQHHSIIDQVPALLKLGMSTTRICEHLVGAGYVDSVEGLRGKPLGLVELPMDPSDLDLRRYPIPRKVRGVDNSHQLPYIRRKIDGGWAIFANINDDKNLGGDICLNLADNLYCATKYRQVNT